MLHIATGMKDSTYAGQERNTPGTEQTAACRRRTLPPGVAANGLTGAV